MEERGKEGKDREGYKTEGVWKGRKGGGKWKERKRASQFTFLATSLVSYSVL